MGTKKTRRPSLQRKALALLAARDRGKACFARADRLLAELRALLADGERIALSPGKVAFVIDNFADGKDVVFRAHGIHRYELRVDTDGA